MARCDRVYVEVFMRRMNLNLPSELIHSIRASAKAEGMLIGAWVARELKRAVERQIKAAEK